MNVLRLLGLCCVLGSGVTMAQKDDAAALAQAEKLAAQGEKQMASLQQSATPSESTRYLAALRKLEIQLKERGELQKVLVLRGEIERAQNATQPLKVPAGLPEARVLQETLLAEGRASQQNAAQKIVAAAGETFKELALLRKDVSYRNHGRIKKLADKISEHAALTWAHELAPELALPKLAEPPPDKPVTLKAGRGDPYTFYPLGKEPPLRNGHTLKLEIAFADLRGALFNYTMAASEAGGLPRVSLTAKNSDFPAGTKLVIEYFDKYPNLRGFLRVSCEHITLPTIPRGSGVAVDGHGMRDYSSKWVDIKSHRPLYGVIISFFDEQGKIILQGCAPSSLMQDCRRNLPNPL